MDKALTDYRQHLVLAEQKAQEDYDKTVIALSGGALGVSLAFIEKVMGAGAPIRPQLLTAAWVLLAISMLSVLVSYFLSRHALRCAIAQVDGDKVQVRRLGGSMAIATEIANVVSGLCFIIGVLCLCFFAIANLEARNAKASQSSTSAPWRGLHR